MLALLFLAGLLGIGVASMVGAPGFGDMRGRLRWGLALIYVGFGLLHVTAPLLFLAIMPPIIPHPEAVVIFTGVCEIFGGVGLILPATRHWAGWALAAYAVCVYPANLYHAFGHVTVVGLPSSWWYHGPRLLLQPGLVWWALYCGNVISWPFASNLPAFARTQGQDRASASPQNQGGPGVAVDAPLDPESPR